MAPVNATKLSEQRLTSEHVHVSFPLWQVPSAVPVGTCPVHCREKCVQYQHRVLCTRGKKDRWGNMTEIKAGMECHGEM
jgi:hypothetical protein